jgi:hypothetical protein
MKSVEIVLKGGGGEIKEKDEGLNLRYIINTYVNVATYPCITKPC